MTIYPHSFYCTSVLSSSLQCLGRALDRNEKIGIHLTTFEGKLQTVSISYEKEPPLNFGFVDLSPFDVERLYAAIEKDSVANIRTWVKNEEIAWKTPQLSKI